MSETLLQMNHIRKHFGDLHVLEDISIEVHRGEVVSIIGPSGSGKSTLLRCATLLEKMDGGDLIYLGEAAAKEEAVERAKKLLEQLGLADKADAYPCQLSGGQQQRVSIARALALQPQILFFDEPTSALDPELTVEVLKVIKELAKQHMTMIIVTHEMQFAKEVSDKIIFMEGGHIKMQGTPEEIFASENERVKEFIGKLNA